ncbi:hypothetical protein P9112_013030 [Eukaryota sp. TZLM1-RC]
MTINEIAVEMTVPNPLKSGSQKVTDSSMSSPSAKHPELQSRQDAMDMARGLSVILMIFHHVIIYFAHYDLWDSPVLIWSLHGPGSVAVMFMFIMGINAADSEKNNARTLAKRGLKILIFAYFLNFVRDQLPLILSCTFQSLCPEDVYLDGYWDMLFILDIFPFVGLCFLYIAMLRHFEINKEGQLTLTAILVLIFSLFEKHSDPTPIFGYFFLGDWYLCYFPFRSWVIFPVFGALIGSYYRPYGSLTKDSVPMKKLLIIALIGWITLFIGMFIFYPQLDHYGFQDETNYYHQDPLTNFFFLCQNVLLLETLKLLMARNLVPSILFRYIKWMSRNITAAYVVSWLVITWFATLITGWYILTNIILIYVFIVTVTGITSGLLYFFPAISKLLKKTLA